MSFWDDLDRLGRNLVALGALVVSAGGGLALLSTRVRRQLGLVLLALACWAAGFAYLNLADDDTFLVSSALVVVCATVGALALRGGAFLVAGWSGAMAFVVAFVLNELERPPFGTVPGWLAMGFLLVTVLLGATGFFLSRVLAWSLAGLSGWACAVTWLFESESGEWFALLTATAVAAARLTAFVAERRYPLAVIGCLILLSLWPACLYAVFSSALGVALGLIAAGAVLIGMVVVVSRNRRRDELTRTI